MNAEVFLKSPFPEECGPRAEIVRSYLQRIGRMVATLRADPEELEGPNLAGFTDWLAPEEAWSVLLELIHAAPEDDRVLGFLAAGPLEEWLGRYGDRVIDWVERQAAEDHRFRRVLTGVWRHGMSEAVWERIRAIQTSVPDPLT